MRKRVFCALTMMAAFAWVDRVGGHGVVIGRHASGALHVHVEAHQPVQLPPSVFPGVDGWAATDPGIAAAEIDDPAEDLFLLNPASNIQFEFIGADPGLQIVTSHVLVPGETINFGPPFFDFHFVFNIEQGVVGTEYALQFKVRDLSGIHADSPVISLSFTAVMTVCACRGDSNADDERSGADIQAFVECMTGATPLVDCDCADMDGDGELDDHDVEHFVEELLEAHHCS